MALFIVGSIGLALAPRFLRTAADQLREKPGWSIVWGILLFIVVPIAALVVGFTLVGIPLSLLAWALWGFAVLFAAIPVALFLGREFTGWLRRGAPLSPYANLAIGLALIALVAAIPVVWLFVWLAVVFFGVGMFALLCMTHEQRRGKARLSASDRFSKVSRVPREAGGGPTRQGRRALQERGHALKRRMGGIPQPRIEWHASRSDAHTGSTRSRRPRRWRRRPRASEVAPCSSASR